MATPDYTGLRGDSIDIEVHWPGADLTGATIRATLKEVLDAGNDDTGALWKQNFAADDPGITDDPLSGVANIHIPPGSPSTQGTYRAKLNKIYTFDAELTMPDTTVVKTLQCLIEFTADATRRQT